METALDREIRYYVKAGYRVVSQNSTRAQLMRPKRFSYLWASLWFLMFGIGLIFYVFWYMSQKDDVIYLELLPNGKVKTTRG